MELKVDDDVTTDEQDGDDGSLASDDVEDGQNSLCCMKHGFMRKLLWQRWSSGYGAGL